ncbi:cytochrome c oxidase assembly protein COX20, mitochondrial [Plodia interpunctella]|uniref:cytochrome c oxidase assembly protein COX20, mitochondrial n=1 Tax=Plodia interpunctella TaxID=58824 RepID=UPI0023677717|nr:cytochrome c oxidase assembly protein COX20, mitochondrial [Plodia interpunctella]
MDTVVKSMLEEDPEEKKQGIVLFGRDLSQIPCFRESFLYGIATGVGFGIAAFIKTSKPMLSQHIGVGTFSMSTLLYWSYCRYHWSKQRFDAQLLQEALKDKILYEGTVVEKELESKGVLKSA